MSTLYAKSNVTGQGDRRLLCNDTGVLLVDNSGTTPIATAALSNVAASITNVTLLAANANRRRTVIVNDSTSNLRIKFGATASSTSFTYLLYPQDTYESVPFREYLGIIDGIWESAVGSARVTEMS
jgi:hypothetical protein